MVKRIDKNTRGEADKPNKQNAAAAITHLRAPHSAIRSHLTENSQNDELIVSLADAYENRRAQQVGEWESRQHVAKYS